MKVNKSLSSRVKERSLDMVGRRLAAFKSAFKKLIRTLESWILVPGSWGLAAFKSAFKNVS